MEERWLMDQLREKVGDTCGCDMMVLVVLEELVFMVLLVVMWGIA